MLNLQKKNKCDYFDRTKYADNILPIDTYKKDVDEIVKRDYTYDYSTIEKRNKDT